MSLKKAFISRFKKQKDQPQWVKDRREICALCPLNTKNMEWKILPFYKKCLIKLSDFYTFITFNEKTNLGNCSLCTCDLYYKTPEITEKCEDNRWKF